MKRRLLVLCLVCLCLCLGFGLTYLYIEKRVTRFELPQGELKWSTTRPSNAKMCIPAAFTSVKGKIAGAYRINGKSYQNNQRMKVSLQKNSFVVDTKWRSSNGFQQLTLVYNKRAMKFRDSRKCIRRALCKNKKETFILESNYPMTMSAFAYYCSRHCTDAVYLDMGEYGYGYIKRKHFTIPLYIWGVFTKNKQTNWLYIE